jgi:hypothetical protein
VRSLGVEAVEFRRLRTAVVLGIKDSFVKPVYHRPSLFSCHLSDYIRDTEPEMREEATIEGAMPVSTTIFPPHRHPARVYLARLRSGSRRTTNEALNTIAGILTSCRGDMETMPWGALRYQHTAAVRAALMEKYRPSTANKMLATLPGVL